MNASPDARLQRALASLEGLSVGDAFGEQFFLSFEMAKRILVSDEFDVIPGMDEDEFLLRELIDVRRLDFSTPIWRWTDDTALALEIVAELREHERILPASLATRFSARYRKEPARGYGGAMHSLLPALTAQNWRASAQELFDGQGSYGNGSAMRVPPLGAYFADDFDLLCEQAQLSAIVTHAHPEAIAGAIATAIAIALCAQMKDEGTDLEPHELLLQIIERTPESETRRRLIQCRDFPDHFTSEQVASHVGSGNLVACEDTVPFCCWCAAHENTHFSEAMWLTVAGLGDRDTTCAIVGGIVGAKLEAPDEWKARREALPGS